MLHRFADFNAGHWASRNAAFQNALAMAAGRKVAMDGDLLLRGEDADRPSQTELVARSLAAQLAMTEREIRRDLERGAGEDFARTRLYRGVFQVATERRGRSPPTAVVPRIRLQSPKITRNLTTEWFAQRVDGRFERCLARAAPVT
jgi:hypothetical protein